MRSNQIVSSGLLDSARAFVLGISVFIFRDLGMGMDKINSLKVLRTLH
jgi:hypothetical protein